MNDTVSRLRSRPPTTALLCGGMIVLLLAGCGGRDLATVGTPANPLVVMLSPMHTAPAASLAGLDAHLESATAMTIEVVVPEGHDAAILRAGSPTFDVGLLPLFDYLFCRSHYGVEAGLRVLRGAAGGEYRGEVVVRADSPVTAINALAGKPVAFVDRYSTSGFLLPAKLFRDAGVTPTSVFAGSHEAALAELRAGRVEAAAVYSGAAGADTTLRVIATTDTVPNEPVFFRKGLDAARRAAVMNALQSFAATPAGAAVLNEVAGVTGFEPTTDVAYESTMAVVRAAGSEVEDLVPEGWRIRHESEYTLDFTP